MEGKKPEKIRWDYNVVKDFERDFNKLINKYVGKQVLTIHNGRQYLAEIDCLFIRDCLGVTGFAAEDMSLLAEIVNGDLNMSGYYNIRLND